MRLKGGLSTVYNIYNSYNIYNDITYIYIGNINIDIIGNIYIGNINRYYSYSYIIIVIDIIGNRYYR